MSLSDWMVEGSHSNGGDIREDLVKHWMKRARKEGVIPGFDAFLKRSVEDFLLPNQADAIVSMLLLHDVVNPPRAFENLANSLSGGGILCMDHGDLCTLVLQEEEQRRLTDEGFILFERMSCEGKFDERVIPAWIAQETKIKHVLGSPLVKTLTDGGYKVAYVQNKGADGLVECEIPDEVKTRSSINYFRITAPEKPNQINLKDFYYLNIAEN